MRFAPLPRASRAKRCSKVSPQAPSQPSECVANTPHFLGLPSRFREIHSDFAVKKSWHIVWLIEENGSCNPPFFPLKFCLKRTPLGNDTQLRRAMVLEHEGRFAEARQLFEECVDDPTFDAGDLFFHCGWCAENEQKPAEALVFYERAAELTHIPGCKLNSFFRAGWVLMHEDEASAAADRFRFAIDYGELVDLKNETYRHSVYWFAHCLALQARYLEALKWYRSVQGLAPQLDPESRLRQLFCLVQTGQYEEALNLCRTFDAPAPEGFDDLRYEGLRAEVCKERRTLETSLTPPPSFRKVVCDAA